MRNPKGEAPVGALATTAESNAAPPPKRATQPLTTTFTNLHSATTEPSPTSTPPPFHGVTLPLTRTLCKGARAPGATNTPPPPPWLPPVAVPWALQLRMVAPNMRDAPAAYTPPPDSLALPNATTSDPAEVADTFAASTHKPAPVAAE